MSFYLDPEGALWSEQSATKIFCPPLSVGSPHSRVHKKFAPPPGLSSESAPAQHITIKAKIKLNESVHSFSPVRISDKQSSISQ